jgi:trigger factor
MQEEVQKEVLKLKKGETFSFNIRTVEKDKDEKHVNKYLLNLDEGEEKEIGDMFRGTIDKVSRISPAEINQEFFDKYTGKEGAETSEEEIREQIKENIASHYNTQTKNLLFKSIMDHLMESNSFDLPDAFLKRWLKLSNEEATDEVIEAEFGAFSENLKWNLIKGKLEAKYEIQVLPEDIKEGFKKRIAGYFGGNPQGIDLDQMAESMMKNQEQFRQVFEEEKAEKLFQAISEDMNIVENNISLDEFKELVKKINEEAA